MAEFMSDIALGELWAILKETSTKIAVGSYSGTGTYGEKSPCELTFDFEPAVVLVYKKSDLGFLFGTISNRREANAFIALQGSAQATRQGYVTDSTNSTITDHFIWDGCTFKWYSSGSGDYAQMNAVGVEYGYIAIGK